MIVARPYEVSDRLAIAALHQAQGLGYTPPDWSKMVVSCLIEVDGEVQAAAFLRKTAETYLLLDPNAKVTRRERLGQLLILHREMMGPAKREKLADVHCWLPPSLEKFGSLLTKPQFGWQPAPWPACFTLEVK